MSDQAVPCPLHSYEGHGDLHFLMMKLAQAITVLLWPPGLPLYYHRGPPTLDPAEAENHQGSVLWLLLYLCALLATAPHLVALNAMGVLTSP